jgi:hypothetical protein
MTRTRPCTAAHAGAALDPVMGLNRQAAAVDVLLSVGFG